MPSACRHDAFISYSRKNEPFADHFERALESFTSPKGLRSERRRLEIFRDKQDFTGNEYHHSLEKHLKDSTKLIVVCSPEAVQSEYVNDEIRRFAGLRGASNIIPVLHSGIPNNEAGPGQESQRAFPQALCEIMDMPLAADYRGWTPKKARINGGRYRDAWYTVLANLYDVSRAEIEERDSRRRARLRRMALASAGVILALIAVIGSVAWKSRGEARAKDRDARQLEYVDNIGLAQAAYDSNDLAGMRELLQKGVPAAGADDFRGFEWYYLSRLAQGPGASVAEHAAPLKAIAFAPDGKQFATGSDDGTVRLWAVDSMKQVGALDARGHAVASIAISPDGRLIAAAMDKAPVTVWDRGSRSAIEELKELGDSVEQVAFSPAGASLAAIEFENGKKVVRIWDAGLKQVTATITGGGTASGSGMLVTFSRDGGTLALSSGFGVKLCRLPGGQSIAEFDGPGTYVTAAAFSPDGNVLAAASDDGKLLFYDVRKRHAVAIVEAHDGYISSVAWSPDGRWLVTAGTDQTVRLWDTMSRKLRTTWKGHTGPVEAAAFSPDGRTVATASADKTARLWNVSGRAEYDEIAISDIDIAEICASSNDDRVALASASGVIIWDASARRELARLDQHSESIADIAFSPDQKIVAIAGSGKAVELWETESRKMEQLAGHTAEVYAVAFSPDGRMLASGGRDGTVRLWNVASRQGTALAGHAKAVTAVAFSPDGKSLATGGNDRTVKLWDTASGRELASEPAISGMLPADFDETQQLIVTAVRFSNDGQLLAAAGADGIVTLWRARGGALRKAGSLVGHTSSVNRIAFSPDGRTIATASDDATVKLWNRALFRELMTFKEPKSGRTDTPGFLRGSENHVSAVVFSHSGRFLMTGLMDGTLRVRQAASR
jgi:WD40 repeat protein